MKKRSVLKVLSLLAIMLMVKPESVESAKPSAIHKVALIVASKPDFRSPVKSREEMVEEKDAAEAVNSEASDYFSLGQSYERAGLYKEAAEAYRQAIGLKPYLIDAHYNLAFSLLLSGDSESVHKEYKVIKVLDLQLADEFYKRAVHLTSLNKQSRYIMQAGAYRNNNYAAEMTDKLKEYYMNAYIEKEGGLYKVRVVGIKSTKEAALFAEDMKRRLGVEPFAIPVH